MANQNYHVGRRLRRLFAQVLAGGALLAGAASVSAAELTVYSTTDADNLKVIAEAFQNALPDIKVNWVRD